MLESCPSPLRLCVLAIMILASISCGGPPGSPQQGLADSDAPFDVTTKDQVPAVDEAAQAAAVATIEKLGGEADGPRNSEGRITHVSFGRRPELMTDAEAPLFQALTSLEELNLGGTGITDKSLVHLRGMSSLQELSLFFTGVTDAGLKELTSLHSLRRLYIGSTNITDAGLEHLKTLNQLQILDVMDCEALSDAGLLHLHGLSELQTLSLRGTNISDAGAVQLSVLSKLEELHLPSQVNDATISKLKTALPGCMIHKARR